MLYFKGDVCRYKERPSLVEYPIFCQGSSADIKCPLDSFLGQTAGLDDMGGLSVPSCFSTVLYHAAPCKTISKKKIHIDPVPACERQ